MVLSTSLVIVAAFAIIISTVMNVTSSFLVDQRMRENLSITEELALELAPYVRAADVDKIHRLLLDRSRQTGGRFLCLGPSGTVQADAYASYSGLRLGHPEVMDIVQGRSNLSYGLRNAKDEGALQADNWIGYYTAAIDHDAQMIGIVFFSVPVQDVFDQLSQIQQTMLLYLVITLLAAMFITYWLATLITQPINALNGVMQQAVRQGFSVRAQVKGRDEVAQLSSTFNAMSEKLQNTDKMRNDFISNASHELKTPLSAIKIMVESLLSNPDHIDQDLAREFLSDINQEVDRLNSIVQDLLTLVRFDGKSMPMKREAIALQELCYDTVQRLRPVARQSGVEIELHLDEICYVNGDALRLTQVVYNLTDNAIKYTPQGGHVSVSLTNEGDLVKLTISDTGIGIPAASLPHVFDRFYRVDKARSRATGGTGLGLSIVQNIVRLHDGDILVDSQEDVGTSFTVYLPRAEDPFEGFEDYEGEEDMHE